MKITFWFCCGSEGRFVRTFKVIGFLKDSADDDDEIFINY